MYFKKILDRTFVQAYYADKVKLNKQFLLIYKTADNEVKSIEADVIPIQLFTICYGFLFVKDQKTKFPLIAKFERVPSYKTNYANLESYFINNSDSNTIIKVTGSNKCSPRITDDMISGFNFTKDDFLDKHKLIESFINKQKKLESPEDWFNYVCKTCPPYNYADMINDASFKKEITFEDISIYYDIHSEFEMDIIKNIESTFENLNQVVLIRQTYNNLVEQIVSKCRSKKIKYKLEPEGVKLKYSDLLKLDITYLITDFV